MSLLRSTICHPEPSRMAKCEGSTLYVVYINYKVDSSLSFGMTKTNNS
jgi:hypothetical protein